MHSVSALPTRAARTALAALALASCGHNDSTSMPPPPTPTPAPSQPSSAPPAHAPRVTFTTAGATATVNVEVVASDAAIEKGLMFRETLPPDDGMLFLLPCERVWQFWMRNTLLSLDIIFISRDLRVVGVAANARPKDETLLAVDGPSVYVVETNAGWAAAHHVGAGAQVQFVEVAQPPPQPKCKQP